MSAGKRVGTLNAAGAKTTSRLNDDNKVNKNVPVVCTFRLYRSLYDGPPQPLPHHRLYAKDERKDRSAEGGKPFRVAFSKRPLQKNEGHPLACDILNKTTTHCILFADVKRLRRDRRKYGENARVYSPMTRQSNDGPGVK
jgi:hypothetical protein